jgi:hypothetical protein
MSPLDTQTRKILSSWDIGSTTKPAPNFIITGHGRMMAPRNEHGKPIAAAAKAALAPLGLVRKGQSRVWRSDQRYWVIGVEFRPSGWSKGSYLNVSAGWLWHRKEFISQDARFPVDDVGDAGFLTFESIEQFRPRIKHMAERAAEEVLAIRERFRTFSGIHAYLMAHSEREDIWPIFHAAVASGLVGDIERSRLLFERVHARAQITNVSKHVTDSYAELACSLHDPLRFRSIIAGNIQYTRRLNRLPDDPDCLDDALDSADGR